MTQDGQFELTDFLSKKIANKSVMDLTAWINSQGKAQYTQIGEIIEEVYNREKDSGELVERLTNAVSVYVLNQSMGYMNYLRKESEWWKTKQGSLTRNGVSMATDNSGNLMFFDTSVYVRSKGKEFDGFRVNINDLVK